MFTPDSLLQIAIDATAAQKVATAPYEAYEHYLLNEEALAVAEWMEQNGITEAVSIGPFGNVALQRGQKVRIKAGAIIRSTSPKISHEGRFVCRPYTVTLFDVSNGCIFAIGGKTYVRDQQVTWTGGGDYWHTTDAVNVEVVA